MYRPMVAIEVDEVDDAGSEEEFYSCSTPNAKGLKVNDDEQLTNVSLGRGSPTDSNISSRWSDGVGSAEEERRVPPLSPVRKLMLFLSLFNCVALVIIFLWVLPCDVDTCHSDLQAPRNRKWSRAFNCSGTLFIDVAPSDLQWREILVIASKRDGGSYDITGTRIIDGTLAWQEDGKKDVKYLNCHLLDVNEDGIHDCLLFTFIGLLALDSRTGELLWKAHSHGMDNFIITSIIKLDVFTNVVTEKKSDLVAVAMDENVWVLAIISGRSGELLWYQEIDSNCLTASPLDLSSCANLTGLQYEKQLDWKSAFTSQAVNAKFQWSLIGNCPQCSSSFTVIDQSGPDVLWNETWGQARVLDTVNLSVKETQHMTLTFHIQRYNQTANGTWTSGIADEIVDFYRPDDRHASLSKILIGNLTTENAD